MLVFALAAFLAFYIPGDVFVRRLRLSLLPRIVLALGFGLALWAFQGFVFGFLGWRFLTYVYLVVFAFLWLKH